VTSLCNLRTKLRVEIFGILLCSGGSRFQCQPEEDCPGRLNISREVDCPGCFYISHEVDCPGYLNINRDVDFLDV
jgi:hypothetical protein